MSAQERPTRLKQTAFRGTSLVATSHTLMLPFEVPT